MAARLPCRLRFQTDLADQNDNRCVAELTVAGSPERENATAFRCRCEVIAAKCYSRCASHVRVKICRLSELLANRVSSYPFVPVVDEDSMPTVRGTIELSRSAVGSARLRPAQVGLCGRELKSL